MIAQSGGSEGFVAFMRTWRSISDAPVQLIPDAQSGTSLSYWIQNIPHTVSGETRTFADTQRRISEMGNDVSGYIFNWGRNESWSDGSTMTEALKALVLNTGTFPDRVNSLANEIAPGWQFINFTCDRNITTGREHTGLINAKAAFAHANGFASGPSAGHMQGDGTGPHQVNGGIYGPRIFGQTLAVAAAMGMGVTPETKPHFANARMSSDNTTILIDIIASRGGEIYSPAPTALRSFMTKQPGDSDLIYTKGAGHSAVLNTSVSPPRVEITKASGTWPTDTVVAHVANGETYAGVNAAEELLIRDGWVFERVLDPVNNIGLAVSGRVVGNEWIPNMSMVVAPSGSGGGASAPVPFSETVTETSMAGTYSVEFSGTAPAGSTMHRLPDGQVVIVPPAGGEVTVDAPTPASATDSANRIYNGAMINPATPRQGFDQRRGKTGIIPDSTNDGFSPSLNATFPATLRAGDSLVKAVGISPEAMETEDATAVQFIGFQRQMASLHVMSTPPPALAITLAPVAPSISKGGSKQYVVLRKTLEGLLAELETYDATGMSGPTNWDPLITSAARHDPAFGWNRKTGWSVASIITMPSRMGGGANYGSDLGAFYGMIALAIFTNKMTTSQKLAALNMLIIKGALWDTNGWGAAADGGINQFHLIPIMFKRWATGEGMGGIKGTRGVTTKGTLGRLEGNSLGQYGIVDQAFLDRLQPHTKSLYNGSTLPSQNFAMSKIRTITYSAGNQIKFSHFGDEDMTPATSGKSKYAHNLKVVRVSDGASAIITNMALLANIQNIDAQPTQGAFAEGQQVYLAPQFTHQLGDPYWIQRQTDDSLFGWRTYTPSDKADYREENNPLDEVLVGHMLGIWPGATDNGPYDWRGPREYVDKVRLGGVWPEITPFPTTQGSLGNRAPYPLDAELFTAYWDSHIKNRPQNWLPLI